MSTRTDHTTQPESDGSPGLKSRLQHILTRLIADYGWVLAEDPRRDGRQLSVVRALPVSESGDGVILLRTSRADGAGIVQQWEDVCWLLADRLTARGVIIATGIFGFADSCDRRPDLEALFEIVRQPGCHWVACADLERLVSGPPIAATWMVEVMAQFGVQIYIADAPDTNLLPARCRHCNGQRGDVSTVAGQALCTDCRATASPRAVLRNLHARIDEHHRARDELLSLGDSVF